MATRINSFEAAFETIESRSSIRQPRVPRVRGTRNSGRAADRRRTLEFRTLRELKQVGTLVEVTGQRA